MYQAGPSFGFELNELPSGNSLINMGSAHVIDGNGYILNSSTYFQTNVVFSSQNMRYVGGDRVLCASSTWTAPCSFGSGAYMEPVIGLMDTLGAVTSMKQYALNSGVCGGLTKGLLPTADSGAIVWGRDYGPFALRVDGSLEPVWSKRLMDAGAFSFFKEFPNGDLLAGINRQTAGVVVARMNAAGEVLWSRSYIRPRGVVSDALIEPDGSFVLVGYTDSTGTTDPIFTPLPPGYNPKLFMMKLNGEGDVLWCKGYRSTTNLWYTRRDAVIRRTLDGQYAVLATLGPPAQHDWFRPYLMKTDLNGDTLWTRSVGRHNYTYLAQDLQASSDGGYMISGIIYGSMPGNQSGLMYIYKADSLGHFECWERVPSIEVMDLFPVDSTVILNIISGVATADPMDFTDSILDSSIFTTYDGCSFTTGFPSTMATRRPIFVRPNPTRGRFTLEVQDPLLKDSFYSVYDATGRLLYQRPLPAGTNLEEIDLTRFGRGTYVLRVTDPEGVRHERVVVE
ncbi:MAG: T9SS type A sorting domain-containing protein [Flavobacteriales bacterium]|nr:T9SS type A sorting domain-containing protein [Flavobacteriales bacterium]